MVFGAHHAQVSLGGAPENLLTHASLAPLTSNRRVRFEVSIESTSTCDQLLPVHGSTSGPAPAQGRCFNRSVPAHYRPRNSQPCKRTGWVMNVTAIVAAFQQWLTGAVWDLLRSLKHRPRTGIYKCFLTDSHMQPDISCHRVLCR